MVNREKIQFLHDQTLHSNASLVKLVEDIRTMMTESHHKPRMPTAWPPYRSSFKEPYGSDPNAMEWFATPASINKPVQPTLPSPGSGTRATQVSGGQRPVQLSPQLLKVNKERSVVGQMEFAHFRRQNVGSTYTTDSSHKRSFGPFLDAEPTTVAQLVAEFESVVISASATKRSRSGNDGNLLAQRIIWWLQGFEKIIGAWAQAPTVMKEEKQLRQNQALKVMLALNDNVERADCSLRKEMYAAVECGGIGSVFEKLRNCLCSVMIEKEIERFSDEKESWLKDLVSCM
jgi:hypothetical protein